MRLALPNKPLPLLGKGSKWHFVVDSLGMPLAVSVTAANVHDLTGAKKVLPQVRKFLLRPSFHKIYADGAYIAKTFKDWAKEKFDATVQISKNLAMQFKRFIPVSQRWVVERTFSWLYDFRRLTIDYERTTRHSRFMLRMAAISLTLNRLATIAGLVRPYSVQKNKNRQSPRNNLRDAVLCLVNNYNQPQQLSQDRKTRQRKIG